MADAGHVLDLALFVAGYPRPTTVSASATRLFPGKRASVVSQSEASAYDVEDLASGHIRFADGSWMTLEVSWVRDALEPSYSFEMVGDRATICFDPLRVMREVDDVVVDITPSDIADNDWDASVKREVEAVVRSLDDGTAPIVALDDALVVQAIIDACYRSIRAGTEVDVGTIG
jgi:predicted dehydrogenase